MRGLLVRRDKGEVPPFRRILVETTGLADPAPIMQMLLNNPLLSHFIRLDAVVTTVEAVNARRQLDRHPEAVKQVAVADRLLLTKTDLCNTASIAAIEGHLAKLNPGATIILAKHGDAPPESLFGATLFDPAHKTPDVQSWLRPDRHEGRADVHHHDHRGIRSFCLTFGEPLSWQTISGWLTMLRQWRGEDLLRVKVFCICRTKNCRWRSMAYTTYSIRRCS